MKKHRTLALALCIGFLLTTVSAGVLDCETMGGVRIQVTHNNSLDDHQECINAGHRGALFHCCDYSNCNVPDPCPEGGATPGTSCCETDPRLDYDGYACCEPQETPTTTVKPSGGNDGGGGGDGGGFTAVPITKATCYDGIQNQGETGIDCGGPCEPCPSCDDGIQNQGETGVDCGGPCLPCPTATTVTPTTVTSTTTIAVTTTVPATTTAKATTTVTDTEGGGALVGLMPTGALISFFLILLLLLFFTTKKKEKGQVWGEFKEEE